MPTFNLLHYLTNEENEVKTSFVFVAKNYVFFFLFYPIFKPLFLEPSCHFATFETYLEPAHQGLSNEL